MKADHVGVEHAETDAPHLLLNQFQFVGECSFTSNPHETDDLSCRRRCSEMGGSATGVPQGLHTPNSEPSRFGCFTALVISKTFQPRLRILKLAQEPI